MALGGDTGLPDRAPALGAQARDFVRSLLVWTDVAVTQRSDAQQALDGPMPDYEVALQAAAAGIGGAAHPEAVARGAGGDYAADKLGST